MNNAWSSHETLKMEHETLKKIIGTMKIHEKFTKNHENLAIVIFRLHTSQVSKFMLSCTNARFSSVLAILMKFHRLDEFSSFRWFFDIQAFVTTKMKNNFIKYYYYQYFLFIRNQNKYLDIWKYIYNIGKFTKLSSTFAFSCKSIINLKRITKI